MTDQPTKKYEFVEGDTIRRQGRVLRRIRAIRDFGEVEKGDLGGYIEKEENLSHEGDCWVFHEAKVFEDASINANANVRDDAKVYGEAEISDEAWVCDIAEVFDSAVVMGGVVIQGSSKVCGVTIVDDTD